MSKIDLFYTLKLNTSDIYEQIAKNGCVETDFKTAKNAGWVVALGDNQLLRFIRQIKDKPFDKEKVQTLYDRRNILKQDKSSKKNAREITKIQNEINELLFVPDLVTVRTDTTQKDYKQLCKTGFAVKFKVNETEYVTKYKRLCAGAGQLRKNSANFVNAEIYDQLLNIMLCGLDAKSIGKINLAKFGAYLALSTSATRVVKTPRICVIDDYEYVLHNQKVDWIYKNDKGEDDIREEYIDFTVNAFDGAGMVSPEMAARWQQDLEIDYLPSSFIIRAPWTKGAVSCFDFHRFAKEVAHKNTIKDCWGKIHNVDDIDVILTKSQFKMAQKYDSYDQYLFYYKKYGHVFGVARANKKESSHLNLLNYQYLQSNDFTEESIKALAQPTVDWLQKVMSCDKLYTSLMMIGCHEKDTLEEIESRLDSPIAKCMLYNLDIINDNYARQKVMRLIRKKIDQAKIGKIYVEGSYDFLIPDLYAMAEHAFGMEVQGLIPAKCAYSKRWVDKGAKKISAQRSPLVAPAENQVLNVYSNNRCQDWFRYITWGNVLSIADLTEIAMSDADNDGDIIATSDNKYLIDAINPELPIITYEKQKAKSQKLNFETLGNFDVKSFDSPIGGITNLASNLYAMLGLFPKDSREYNEIEKRIRLLRRAQGDAIDKAKGVVYSAPPKYWSHRQKYIQITDDMTDEQKQEIQKQNEEIKFNNSICCDKKTYFFGYVYPKEMARLKHYKKKQGDLCRKNFGCKLKDLKQKQDKTVEERQFLRNYYKYMPLFNSNCTMNNLARYVEDYEFKENKSSKYFDYSCLMSNKDREFKKNICKQIQDVIHKFQRNYPILLKKIGHDRDWGIEDANTLGSDRESFFDGFFDYYKNELMNILSNEEELVDYIIYVYYEQCKSADKSLLWELYSDVVLNNVKNNSDHYYKIVESVDGQEFFGKKFILQEVAK